MNTYNKNFGYFYAIFAAILFGISTPSAKVLLHEVNPWLLAGLFYLGSGLGLFILYLSRLWFNSHHFKEAPIKGIDWLWLLLATAFGGILAPIFLMFGLTKISASSAALLLNLEMVFTALIAWIIFKEHIDRRIAAGMAAIAVAGILLTWKNGEGLQSIAGALLLAGSCLCWAIDNNFTGRVCASDPIAIVMSKSIIAGLTNIILASLFHPVMPSIWALMIAAWVGFFGYGLSLICFIIALRHIGTARTSACFALAPFVGVLLSVIFLGDALSWQLMIAAILMAVGIYLHVSEYHQHEHTHQALAHDHKHTHDEHHQHEHNENDPAGQPHTHWHQHEPLMHSHPHYPDIHHQHKH